MERAGKWQFSKLSPRWTDRAKLNHMAVGALHMTDITFLSLNEIQLGLKIGFVQNNTQLGATAFDQVCCRCGLPNWNSIKAAWRDRAPRTHTHEINQCASKSLLVRQSHADNEHHKSAFSNTAGDSCGLPRRSVQPKSNLRRHRYLFLCECHRDAANWANSTRPDMKQNLLETRIVGHRIHLAALAHTLEDCLVFVSDSCAPPKRAHVVYDTRHRPFRFLSVYYAKNVPPVYVKPQNVSRWSFWVWENAPVRFPRVSIFGGVSWGGRSVSKKLTQQVCCAHLWCC